jgi:molybdenum cofactor cytidylyltransferase
LTQKVSSEPRTAAIILAAGAATRMGQLKQLLAYRGRTLLQHAIHEAIGAGFEPVIVVLGSNYGMLRDAIAGEPIQIVQNERWEAGMGSSITVGVQMLLECGEPPSALAILVVDQPFVEAKHLRAMRQLLSEVESSIVAAQYSRTSGVPALFKREVFDVLISLPPQAGARHLLRGSDVQVTPFPLPEAAFDVDTPEDFKAFTSAAELRHRT